MEHSVCGAKGWRSQVGVEISTADDPTSRKKRETWEPRRPASVFHVGATIVPMFATPTDALTFDDVQNFCRARPREGVTLDYKVDFPKRLDKTIAAFANTYGGYILIGVDETATGEPVLPIAGVPLVGGLRERVVATALDAILPPVNPEVKVVEFKSPGATSPDRAVVVVRVHESDDSAHAVDNGKMVYLRVDNISDHFIRQATISEVEWLLNKRRRPLELKEQLLSEARKRAANYL
jgi:Putative DNA-binding domain